MEHQDILDVQARIEERRKNREVEPEVKPLVELPTDEINIEAAEKSDFTAVPLEGEAQVGQLYSYTFSDDLIERQTVNDLTTEVAQPAFRDAQREIVQKSIGTLRELTNVPDVQKALEAEGLTVDFNKVFQEWYDATGWKPTDAVIRPMTEEEKANTAVACACTDCVEAADTVDTDLEMIVADMSERLASLEARIALFNVKASHKI